VTNDNAKKDDMKLKDIARITPTNKLSSGESTSVLTAITYKTVKELGPEAHLRKLVLATVYEYNEPLSVLEVTAHINNAYPELNYSDAIVRYNLEALLKEGDVLMRQETLEERTIRANGVPVTMNKPAHMFFRKGIGIPYRKTAELVPGVKLKGQGSHARRPKAPSTKAFNPKATAEEVLGTPRPSSDMAALDFMIEKLVAERTAELQKKLDDANAKLAEFKKLLS
jgi:hypothetical protein